MQTADKNLSLRTKVLEIALDLEQNVNQLLLTYLNIENEQRKAITNKSGNIPFKSKIDLLYDLDVFDKDEHKIFLLIMEFRNQFLHNIECNSFKQAVSTLGEDKRKSLLKFSNLHGAENDEDVYETAFGNLYHLSLKIALAKIEKKSQAIEDKREFLVNFQENAIYLVDSIFDMSAELIDKYIPDDSDSPDVVELKAELIHTIKRELDKIFSSEKYLKLRSDQEKFHYEDRIKKFFK